MSKVNHVETFPLDAIVSIDISGAFYIRLAQLLLELLNKKSPDDLLKAMAELKTRDPKDNDEYHILTMMVLVNEIEQTVKKTGKFDKVEVPEEPTSPEKSGED
jgi:ATP-dependent protease HslVU (ClpYQ) peptidase subunit